jgi:hypothetical protein
MNQTEFRQAVRDLLANQVGELSLDEKLAIVQQCIVDHQQAGNFDDSNKGKPWTDDELRIILQTAPTKENCILLARAFRRGYGSIEQIFRWAATPGPAVKEKRPDDAFVQQIKRVAKQVGWRATG